MVQCFTLSAVRGAGNLPAVLPLSRKGRCYGQQPEAFPCTPSLTSDTILVPLDGQ